MENNQQSTVDVRDRLGQVLEKLERYQTKTVEVGLQEKLLKNRQETKIWQTAKNHTPYERLFDPTSGKV